jgi:hypothetical protein
MGYGVDVFSMDEALYGFFADIFCRLAEGRSAGLDPDGQDGETLQSGDSRSRAGTPPAVSHLLQVSLLLLILPLFCTNKLVPKVRQLCQS